DFHFVWKRMTGNFILSTRARFIGRGVEAHRKVGWTIRPSLDANAPHVTAALHGDGLASLQFRRTAGAITEENKSADSLPNPDAATGNAPIVHQYRRSFQAPNWTRDGKALIYAQEGRLYRFDLASRTAAAINTGFATRNNNDHVLSFDGRMMAISNHAPEDSG